MAKKAVGKRRGDGWENLITGLGNSLRDKRLGASIVVAPSSSQFQLYEDLFHGDDMAATIAELPAKEAIREWFNLLVDDSEEANPANNAGRKVVPIRKQDAHSAGSVEVAKVTMQSLDELEAQAKTHEALV